MNTSGSGDDGPRIQLDAVCQQIQNPDRRTRQLALQTLVDWLENSPQVGEAKAKEVFDQMYLVLIKCYADRFEVCRHLAASAVSAVLVHLPDNQYYAENVVPVVARRIGQTEIIEESEEVRLLLVGQLLVVIRKFGSSDGMALQQCYNHIMDVLLKTLTDPYPAIPRLCCEVVEALATGCRSFPVRAEQLVAPLVTMLGHRQSPTRIAAIRTLGTVALKISSSSDSIVKCIISVSPLLMDEQPTVRKECGRVGCRWLLELRDRYSFFERLIPLVLCCLKDDSEETRTEIEASWRQCGEQYYQENEQELTKVEIVEEQHQQLDRYPAGVRRPTLGCRAIVQRSLRVCSIITREMDDWKDEVRIHTLKFMWHFVLHSERALTAKFIEVAPVLLRHCVDPVKEVSEQALKVSSLLGMLLRYSDWIQHGLEALRACPHLGQMKCFTEMFRNSHPDERKENLRDVCEILVNPVICHNIQLEYQRTLLDLLGILVEIHLQTTYSISKSLENIKINSSQSVEELLYTILAKVISLLPENDALFSDGLSLLSRLAEPSSLHRRFLSNVLATLADDLDSDNSERSEPILQLHGLIKLGGFQPETLTQLTASIETVMNRENASAKIKVLSAVSVAMLHWSESMDLPVEQSTAALHEFIRKIVEPVLTWRAGRNAEALRAIATTALCSASQGAETEVEVIFGGMGVQFVALIEDNNVVTRAYGLRCLFKCGPMPMEQMKPLMLGEFSSGIWERINTIFYFFILKRCYGPSGRSQR